MLLSMTAGVPHLADRLGMISSLFVGRPYLASPLVGAPEEPEQMVSRLDAFDCVTYVESVLALGGSRHPDDYEPRLAALRYHRGQLAWPQRNHYMTLWLERNEAAGLVRPVAKGDWVPEGRPRSLSLLAGYPTVERTLAYLPVQRVGILDQEARTGDVVCFVSTKPDLDTFHVGIAVARPQAPLQVRHASRSAGKVVEQELQEFLANNETPGLLIARPQNIEDLED